MSRIVDTEKPTACKARSALSRPEPGPLTSISSVSMPCSRAFLPASSAATWAAYGVLLRLPLKPWLPAEDQAIALPWASVMVMTVLLKVAATWGHACDDILTLFAARPSGCGGFRHGCLILLQLPTAPKTGAGNSSI